FQLGILWAHAMAAVAWVGGSLFYAVVLTPAVTELGPTPERRSLLVLASREFREVVRLAIVVFVVTGVVLAFTRLGQPRISTGYVVVLTVKVALSLWMFWLAGRVGLGSRVAIIGGLARFDGQSVVVIGHQKGRVTRE